jgi:replicative superfamily II helicase
MNFKESVDYVRNKIFPKWDKERKWDIIKCEPDEIDGAKGFCTAGFCDKKRKIIKISRSPYLMFIIHEISHAVTTQCHMDRWLKRMKKAADTAKSINNKDLYWELIEEIEIYTKKQGLRANDIYSWIYDIVSDHPNISLEQVKEQIAAELDKPAEEIFRRCRNAKSVFDEAKKIAISNL